MCFGKGEHRGKVHFHLISRAQKINMTYVDLNYWAEVVSARFLCRQVIPFPPPLSTLRSGRKSLREIHTSGVENYATPENRVPTEIIWNSTVRRFVSNSPFI